MTREEYKHVIAHVYATVQVTIRFDPNNIPPPEVMNLLHHCYCVLEGIGDAILEIRDNSREIDPLNPFGHDYQERINKP